MKPIPYGRQQIDQADIDAVVEALQADMLTTGPRIERFEQRFAAYVGARHAVAVANGTAALHLSAMAMGVDQGSKVITTPMTFSASANCVRYCGGHVVFSDIDPSTALLDIEGVRRLLEQAPRGSYQGIIPVDFAGYAIDMEALRGLADEWGLWVIEDACHAPGGGFIDSKGETHRCGDGAYAELAIFSFHPVKHIACGEGGMITTNNGDLCEQLRSLRCHGMTRDAATQREGGWAYDIQRLGFNYRLTDIQCALGISQLAKADEGLTRRRQIARRYDEAFADGPVTTIQPSERIAHAYHLYVIQVDNRRQVYEDLRAAGIFAQIHYIPVHKLSCYQHSGCEKVAMPAAEAYYERCLSLPMYPSLTDDEQAYVIDKVLAFTA